MKRYMGTRFDQATGSFSGQARVVVIGRDGNAYRLPHRVRHSPCGFEWGYRGSGPAELARCILIDYLDDADPPPVLYLRFTEDVIAGISGDPWVLTADEIRAWLGQTLRSPEGSGWRSGERISPGGREPQWEAQQDDELASGDDRPGSRRRGPEGEGGEAGCRS